MNDLYENAVNMFVIAPAVNVGRILMVPDDKTPFPLPLLNPNDLVGEESVSFLDFAEDDVVQLQYIRIVDGGEYAHVPTVHPRPKGVAR